MYQGYGWRLIVDFAVSAKIDVMISEKINNIDICYLRLYDLYEMLYDQEIKIIL